MVPARDPDDARDAVTGAAAFRRTVLAFVAAGVVYTAVVLGIDSARVALTRPAIRVSLETAMVVSMAGAATLMVLLERRARPSGRDAFIAALLVQAAVNFVFGVLPFLRGEVASVDETFYPWLAGRYVAGTLLLSAALGKRPAAPGPTVAGGLLAVLVLEVAISTTALTGPVRASGLAEATPFGLIWVLEAGPLIMFAAGAFAAGRLARSSGEPLEHWLSLALLVGVFTQVHEAAFPASLGSTITSADLLRATSAALLLAGTAHQVLQLKRQRDAAIERLQLDLDLSWQALQRAHVAAEREAAFMSVVGHELAAPIGVINAQTHLLRDMTDTEAAPLVDTIAGEAERLGGLVRRMDELRELDSTSFEVVLRPVAIEPLLEEVAAFGRGLPGGHPVNVDAEPARVSADPVRLGQVLRNLVANAARFAPDGTPVTITGHLADSGYDVTVVDEGPGVAGEDPESLFEPYVRGRGANNRAGTGLGLHVVRRIVEAHNGRVGFAMPQAPGARVVVNLELA